MAPALRARCTHYSTCCKHCIGCKTAGVAAPRPPCSARKPVEGGFSCAACCIGGLNLASAGNALLWGRCVGPEKSDFLTEASARLQVILQFRRQLHCMH